MLSHQTHGYKMRVTEDRELKRTQNYFVDDLKVYQEDHEKLELMNKIFVKESMDTGACYGMKKMCQDCFYWIRDDENRYVDRTLTKT